MKKGVAAIVVMSLVFTLFLGGVCFAEDLRGGLLAKPIARTAVNEHMETTLQVLLMKYEQDPSLARVFAQTQGIDLRGDMVTVVLEPHDGNSASIDQSALRSFGASDIVRSRSLMRVRVPVDKLDVLANQVSGVGFIRLPLTPVPSKMDTSEGVSLAGAESYHDHGYYGQNARVAIIDAGFNHLTAAEASGDIPASIITSTHDYTGSGLETGTNHGTDVAEIVHDMAPQAQLYLMKIGDEVDLENAKDAAIAAGVHIINHSIGWFNASFYDGTGVISDIAADARDHGILWVNSAGNSAQNHWEGSWSDDDADGWLNFTSTDECQQIGTTINANDRIIIYMTWDAWPHDAEDYDLYLLRKDGGQLTQVSSSTEWQTGTQPPTERISYDVTTTGEYCFAIGAYDAPSHPDIDVFVFVVTAAGDTLRPALEHQVNRSSIPDPGVDERVVTVGAINYSKWVTGPQEAFSSQGPSNASKFAAARTKPDIMGPDGVSTSGFGSFYGTSAGSPHVAGAAALLLSEDPTRTADQLQAKLESDAIDMGAAGKDNIYGEGRLSLTLSSNAAWTFMVYLCGDNSLESAYLGLFSILERASSNQNVNIVVQLDRSPLSDPNDGGSTAYGDWQDTRRFHIVPGMTPSPGNEEEVLGECDMADPDTLAEFVDWAQTNYPADHYLLAICNHGGGWEPKALTTQGIVWDNTDNDYMTTNELGDALSRATGGGTHRLDILLLDACLMQMIEVEYETREYWDYLVASQYIGWTPGPYDDYISHVTPSLTPERLARDIVEDYHASLSVAHTLSAVQSPMDAVVQAVNALATALVDALPDHRTQIRDARDSSQKFHNDEYIDLYHFAELIKTGVGSTQVQNAAQAVMDAVTTAIIAEAHDNGTVQNDPFSPYPLDNAHGMSIYFPRTKGDPNFANYSDTNLLFVRDGNWDEFLRAYFQTEVAGVDSMLVIDHSTSMGSRALTRLEQAKEAAKYFIAASENGDEIGVAAFGSTGELVSPLTPIGSDDPDDPAKVALRGQVDSITLAGATNFGAGLQIAYDQLDASVTSNPKVAVLMSDGQNNTGDYTSQVQSFKTRGWPIYTVALGSNADEVRLQQIADDTGALMFRAGNVDLTQIYNLILAHIKGQSVIANIRGWIAQGQTILRSVPALGIGTESVRFALTWGGSDLDMNLVRPNGSEITPDYANSDPTIEYYKAGTTVFYRIDNPDPGQWGIKIHGTVVPPEQEEYIASVTTEGGVVTNFKPFAEHYDLGEEIVVGVTMKDSSGPIIGASVGLTVIKPSGLSYHFVMFDDGAHHDGAANDGWYGQVFDHTDEDGLYEVHAEVNGPCSCTLVYTIVVGDNNPVRPVTVSIAAPDQATADSDFVARVNINEVTNFDAANYDVTYDPSVLRLDDVTAGQIGSTQIPVDTHNEISSGTWRIVQNVPVSGVTGSGYLAELHFHVLENAPCDTQTAIDISNGVLADVNAQSIPAHWVGDSVTIQCVGQCWSFGAVQITAQGSGTDTQNWFGVDPSGTDCSDILDIPEPPTSPAPYTALWFVLDPSCSDTTKYTKDIKASIVCNETKTWTMQVADEGDAQQVTLSWDSQQLPTGGCNGQLPQVTFLDKVTGTVTNMRTSSSYSYTKQSNPETREFTITVGCGCPEMSTDLSPTGWHMITLPGELCSSCEPWGPGEGGDLICALSDDLDPCYIFHYDPTTGGYVMAPPAEDIPYHAGMGFWVRTYADNVTVDAEVKVPTGTVEIPLGNGWNQIGNPFNFAVAANALKVRCGDTELSLTDAQAQGWVSAYLFGYDTASGGYVMIDPTTGCFQPWNGYWMRSYRDDCVLIIPPTVCSSSAPAGRPMSLKELRARGLEAPPQPPTLRLMSEAVLKGLKVYNIPNPIRSEHTTTFKVEGKGADLVQAIRVEIYDQAGQRVFTQDINAKDLEWHTVNDAGDLLANGVYLYQVWVKIGDTWYPTGVRKLAVVR